jgi:hypothetical protein
MPYPRLRLRAAAQAIVAVLIGTVASAFATARPTPPMASHCPAPPQQDQTTGLFPLPKNVRVDCLREIASRQLIATTIQQDFVPSSSGCETSPQHPNTTQISVTAYQGVDQTSFLEYAKKDGYLVARIDNMSNCDTQGIRLVAGHSYFFVVESNGTKARLVDVGGPPGEIPLNKFTSCTLDHHPPLFPEAPHNVAFLRTLAKQCNHDPVPEGQLKALFSARNDAYLADSAKSPSARAFIDSPFALWISCGTDCCFADQ